MQLLFFVKFQGVHLNIFESLKKIQINSIQPVLPSHLLYLLYFKIVTFFFFISLSISISHLLILFKHESEFIGIDIFVCNTDYRFACIGIIIIEKRKVSCDKSAAGVSAISLVTTV